MLPTAGKPKAAETAETSFADVLAEAIKRGIEATEQSQLDAEAKARQLATGEIQDIAEAMIASERANLTLGVAIAVRNKVVEAYQEIMRLQI